MASTIDDIMPVIRPVWALHQRLLYHTASVGRMLYGLNLDMIGVRKVTGVTDLPLLQYIGVDEREDQSVGGARNSKVDVYDLSLSLMTNIDYGMFRLDPVADTAAALGLLEWSALIRDALQTNNAGELDDELAEYGPQAKLVKPMTFETKDSFPEQISWESTIVVQLWTQLYYPGKRSAILRGPLKSD